MKLNRQVEELIVEIMTRDDPSFLPERCENFLAWLHDAGFVIAPREPTKEMNCAGVDAFRKNPSAVAIYKAMLDAR